MGIVEDTVEPGAVGRRVREHHVGLGSRARSILAGSAAVVILGVVAQVALIGPSNRMLTAKTQSTTVDPGSSAFADEVAPQRPEKFLPTGTGPFLAVIEADADSPDQASAIVLLDLGTGSRRQVSPPESLLDTEPVAAGNHLVVVGKQGAWIGNVNAGKIDWTFLGSADIARPSSHPDRVWLRTKAATNRDASNDQARFHWIEMSFSGEITRSLFRNQELSLLTPELTTGRGTGVFRLATQEEKIALGISTAKDHWRPLSIRGVVVAIGPNDLVTSECLSFLKCNRVWYDAVTGEPRTGLYTDLANNVDPRFVAFLSPFGRFSASEIDDSLTKISSIASEEEINNLCRWGGSISWSPNSDLLACDTADGIEVYDAVANRSLGLVSESNAAWRRVVFVAPDGDLH